MLNLDINLYIAERDPQPGTHIGDKIKSHLNSSDEVLILYTPHITKTVHQEIGLASDDKRPNKPVFLADDHNDLSALHKGVECFMIDRKDLVTSVERVINWFKGKLPSPATPALGGSMRTTIKQPVCSKSDNPKVFFNLTWDLNYAPKVYPKYIRAEGVCAQHGLELKKNYYEEHLSIGNATYAKRNTLSLNIGDYRVWRRAFSLKEMHQS